MDFRALNNCQLDWRSGTIANVTTTIFFPSEKQGSELAGLISFQQSSLVRENLLIQQRFKTK